MGYRRGGIGGCCLDFIVVMGVSLCGSIEIFVDFSSDFFRRCGRFV